MPDCEFLTAINAAAPGYCEAGSPLLLLSRISISAPVFDPTLLTTFMAVAKAAGFSEAGRRLNLRQSTVSEHIRRLLNRRRGGGCLFATPTP